jgi:glycosyltransferase involved in cell wall biosynthesis
MRSTRKSSAPTRILFVHSASQIRGGNRVLLGLIDGLDRSRFVPMSVIPEPGPLTDELRRRDVPHAVLDLRPKATTRIEMARLLLRLRWLCSTNRVDVIHANDPFSYRMASLGVVASATTRMCTVHHPGQTRESLAWAFRRPPRLVLTPSHFMRRQLEDRLDGRLQGRLQVVWNQVDTEWFRPAESVPDLKRRLGLDPDGFELAIVAALTPHKGHRCFLHMARLVLEEQPRTTFHIIGAAGPDDLEYADSLRQLAADLGVAGRVRFWGFATDEMARDLLRASDLFVLPTLEEGFGLAPAEAQACGVPVLTSAIPPLDEVVDHGRTGFLLDPDDPASFAGHASTLLASADARRRMGAEGRRWVVERFGRRSYLDRMESIYDGLAGVSGRASD